MPGDLDGRVIRPMKAVAGELPSANGEWGYEIKWDGMRIVAFLDADGVRLQSANGNDATASFPELQGLDQLRAGFESLILDGEVVAIGDDGAPSFGRLQHRMHVSDVNDARRRAVDVPVSYAVFDLLHVNGQDTMALPLRDRRQLLEQVVDVGPHWRLTDMHTDDPASLLATVTERGLEGLVAKRLTSTYVEGKRSAIWRKVKPRLRQEFVVGGWSEGRDGNAGGLGSLLLGYIDDGVLHHCGSVGSGLTAASRLEWHERLSADAKDDSPFASEVPRTAGRRFHWSEPCHVVEVAFGEWPQGAHLRHPVYLGFRTDKSPESVVREQ
jgi:bifunctional non-homologous end joining protein LigD